MKNGEEILIKGHTANPKWCAMCNVAGELRGTMSAINLALSKGIKTLNICYDYDCIGAWADGKRKMHNPLAKQYAGLVKKARQSGLNIHFIKVKGHSGIPDNIRADKLAKEAAGI